MAPRVTLDLSALASHRVLKKISTLNATRGAVHTVTITCIM